MRTVVPGTPPVEIERLIALRRATGAARHDEVWEGEYHMSPAARMAHSLLAWRIPALLDRLGAPAGLHASAEFNLGEPSDYRVPDGGLHTTDADGLWLASAALVVEILSPDDETWAKLPFYAAREVAEIVIVDPGDRSVRWLRLEGGRYVATASSALLGIDVDELTALIDWPPTAP